jgi:hypothetical protein
MVATVILDVNPDGRALAREEDFLRKLDLPVETCYGPDREGGCPLLRGEACRKIEIADGVIFQLDLDQPRHRRLLAKYARYFEDQGVPIRAVVTSDQKARWANLLRLVDVWTPPIGVSKLDGFASEVEYGWERAPKELRPASGRRS